jgi:predicted DNA-binding transcriptional regulator AlpA
MSNETSKASANYCYPPRAMRAEQAAAYLAMSKSVFLKLVNEGCMPVPVRIQSMVSWDRFDLDAAYDAFKQPAPKNSVHEAIEVMKASAANAPPRKRWSAANSRSYRDGG